MNTREVASSNEYIIDISWGVARSVGDFEGMRLEEKNRRTLYETSHGSWEYVTEKEYIEFEYE